MHRPILLLLKINLQWAKDEEHQVNTENPKDANSIREKFREKDASVLAALYHSPQLNHYKVYRTLQHGSSSTSIDAAMPYPAALATNSSQN